MAIGSNHSQTQLQALELQELQGVNLQSRPAAQGGEVERAAGSCTPRPRVIWCSWSPSAPETSQPSLHPTTAFLLHLQNVPCVLCVPEKWEKIKSAISTLQGDN